MSVCVCVCACVSNASDVFTQLIKLTGNYEYSIADYTVSIGVYKSLVPHTYNNMCLYIGYPLSACVCVCVCVSLRGVDVTGYGSLTNTGLV